MFRSECSSDRPGLANQGNYRRLVSFNDDRRHPARGRHDNKNDRHYDNRNLTHNHYDMPPPLPRPSPAAAQQNFSREGSARQIRFAPDENQRNTERNVHNDRFQPRPKSQAESERLLFPPAPSLQPYQRYSTHWNPNRASAYSAAGGCRDRSSNHQHNINNGNVRGLPPPFQSMTHNQHNHRHDRVSRVGTETGSISSTQGVKWSPGERHSSRHHRRRDESSRSASSTTNSISSSTGNESFSSTSQNSVRRTSAISFRSSHHGRLRRQQRQISRRQVQKAIKYGYCENQGNGRSKYIYEGITFIVDNRTRTEITSYENTLDLPYHEVSDQERKRHYDVKRSYNNNKKGLSSSSNQSTKKKDELNDGSKPEADDNIVITSSSSSSASSTPITSSSSRDEQLDGAADHDHTMKVETSESEKPDAGNPLDRNTLVDGFDSSQSHNNNGDIGDDDDDSEGIVTSHSVIVVDTSGSMKNSDVRGSRNRLAAVWHALAEDFVRQRIECGVAKVTDIVTIILMGEKPKVLFEYEPTSWLLYNQILRIFKLGTIRPRGHGCYLPSLRAAEKVLERYYDDNASNNANHSHNNCPLMLVLLSDGRPSDSALLNKSWDHGTELIRQSVANLASKLGKRLTVQTIGMGNGTADQFQALRLLCTTATEYGCHSKFQIPSLSCAAATARSISGGANGSHNGALSLGGAVSSVATSLTDTQTTLLNHRRANRRVVRQVQRESRKQIPMLTEIVDTEEFNIFMGENAVSRMIFQHDSDNATEESAANGIGNVVAGNGKFVKTSLVHPDAVGVAMRKKPFGEGTERFAYQFFEVGADGLSVVGDAMVAKESKYMTNKEWWEDMDKFVRRFCRIQYHANLAAIAFNQKLDGILHLDPDTPRIQFTPCSVYYIQGYNNDANKSENGNENEKKDEEEEEEYAVIVEERLYGKFYKWNSNNGWIRKSKTITQPRSNSFSRDKHSPTLPRISEDQNDENRDDNSGAVIEIQTIDGIKREVLNIDATDNDDENAASKLAPDEILQFSTDDIAQSFSHFSYIHSGRKMIICDLQGVYNPSEKLMQFTDPVIHYYDEVNQTRTRKYGSTDRGEKGIHDFWKTHQCNQLCNIVTKGFINIS